MLLANKISAFETNRCTLYSQLLKNPWIASQMSIAVLSFQKVSNFSNVQLLKITFEFPSTDW